MVTPLLLCLTACLSSLVLTQVVRRLALRIGAVDYPAARKMHQHPIPRLGGVGIVGAMGFTFLACYLGGLLSEPQFSLAHTTSWRLLCLGGAIIFMCGLWDDVRPISARTKFLVQLAAAGIAVWSGVRLDRIAFAGDMAFNLGALSVPLAILWIVGITNAFNLIDGLDGLSAGLGSIAAATCAAIFFYSGAVVEATVLVMLTGALLGFLPWNFNPAKIFLGDSGSLVLGYILAVTVLTGSQRFATATAVVIPLLSLGVPIIDTLLSMVRRMFGSHSGEHVRPRSWRYWLSALKQVFMADRDHIHHRLMARGLSHRGAVLALYAIATSASALALVAVIAQYRNAVLLLITVAVATAIGIAKLGYLDSAVSRIGSAFEQVDRPRFDRSFFFGFADLVLITMAYWGAYFLLAAHNLSKPTWQWHLNMFPIVTLVQLSLFWISGLYRGLWRAVDVGDLMRVALSVSAGGVLSYSLVIIGQPPDGTGSLFIVHTLLLGWLMGGLRSAYRLVDYSHFQDVFTTRPVLIYGAGFGGRLLLRELRQNGARGFKAVGFIDDDRKLCGKLISGLPVLGTGQDLHVLLPHRHIHTLLLSSRAISGVELEQALSVCHTYGVHALRTEYLFEPLSVGSVTQPVHIRRGEDRSKEIRRLRNAIASLRKAAI